MTSYMEIDQLRDMFPGIKVYALVTHNNAAQSEIAGNVIFNKATEFTYCYLTFSPFGCRKGKGSTYTEAFFMALQQFKLKKSNSIIVRVKEQYEAIERIDSFIHSGETGLVHWKAACHEAGVYATAIID